MPKIIRDQHIVDDKRAVFNLAEHENVITARLPDGPTLFPLTVWLARRDEILAHNPTAGVWLESGEDPAAIAGDLESLPVIAVNFPKFTDGRSYSTARLLRERYGYRGEIRAIGDVLQDQLFYMQRCGINAFALKEDKDLEAALAGFRVFSERYQAAVDEPQPLFRRRDASRRIE